MGRTAAAGAPQRITRGARYYHRRSPEAAIFWQSFGNLLATFWQSFGNRLAQSVPTVCQRIASQSAGTRLAHFVPKDCHTIAKRLPTDCQSIFWHRRPTKDHAEMDRDTQKDRDRHVDRDRQTDRDRRRQTGRQRYTRRKADRQRDRQAGTETTWVQGLA